MSKNTRYLVIKDTTPADVRKALEQAQPGEKITLSKSVGVTNLRGVADTTLLPGQQIFLIQPEKVESVKREGKSKYSGSFMGLVENATTFTVVGKKTLSAEASRDLALHWARKACDHAIGNSKQFKPVYELLEILERQQQGEKLDVPASLVEKVSALVHEYPTGKMKSELKDIPRYGTRTHFFSGREETGWWSVPTEVSRPEIKPTSFKKAWATNAVLAAAKSDDLWGCGMFARSVFGEGYIYQQEADLAAVLNGGSFKKGPGIANKLRATRLALTPKKSPV